MCYNNQKDNNTPQIDSRFWRQNTDLFKEGKISLVKKNFRDLEQGETQTTERSAEVSV